jgi:hypothetical protein
MMTTVLAQIGELLSEVGARGTFAARRTAAADDLYVEVKGLGRLRFPISRTQAQRLCRMARPARYGRGEQTLLDRQVRDTWEIPKSRVKIDQRRWNRTLLPVLEALRADLGLSDGCKLKAELHGMLVYAPGQFFLRHQDSEKADGMIGTLVVTLPGSFKGGAMTVEHQGEKVTYRASRQPLSFIAFYADCHHEVSAVKEGYRIVLTYNLVLVGDGAAAATGAAEPAPEKVGALAERIREHFATPLPSHRTWEKDAPPREPPSRLVYLLDHQYTERGLGWHRLKGEDAARVAALRAAAERAGCEMVLALAEVQETWDCMEEDWYRPRYGRRHRWERDEDDEWQADDEPPADDPDGYTLGDLQDRSITLHGWLDPSGKKAEPIVTHVDDEEVCSTTPSSALEPYASEHEGYMGNYGNTIDRWYRRAAIVLWPRERAFAVRAEASPFWALEVLKQHIRAGRVPQAQQMAASLLPFWRAVAAREERRGFFDRSLHVAEGLDSPALAASLLQPFGVEALTSGRAPAFVALVKRYGEDWARSLLSEWSDPHHSWRRDGRDRLAWLASLPRLCEALRAADDAVGTLGARLLLQDQWEWSKETIKERRGLVLPSQRDKALASLAEPIRGWLESAAVVKADDLRDGALAFFCAGENEALLPCLVQMLRAAAETVPPAMRGAVGLDAIHRHCVRLLEARLEKPARNEDDWSIALPRGCHCELCATLGTFLADPGKRLFEWPIAEVKRRHVHGRLDTHELPVRHETRRSGSPYVLVLSKTTALFEREAAERRAWQADLAWLARMASSGGPGRTPGARRRRTKV